MIEERENHSNQNNQTNPGSDNFCLNDDFQDFYDWYD